MIPRRRHPTTASRLLGALPGLEIARFVSTINLHAQDKSEPFTVEYYYKVKWGYTAEWFDSSVIARRLYPEQTKVAREEQRRFELLLEHMDAPGRVDDLKGWSK